MKRYMHDFRNFVMKTGQLGCLKAIDVRPIIANDSFKQTWTLAIRFSQMKRWITLNPVVDVFTFYVKHRHVYTNWEDFVKEGIDQSTDLLPDEVSISASAIDYMPVKPGQSCPAAYYKGYADIWNEYFRIPNVTNGEDAPNELENRWLADLMDDTDVISATTQSRERKYGKVCARLPHMWNVGVYSDVDSTLEDIDIDAATTPDSINLSDIGKAQALFGSEIDRNWFANRYRDLIQNGFGSTGVSVDADQRPTLCAHTRVDLDGRDILGTAGSDLGDVKGRTEGMVQHSMNWKYFNEHGMLWTLVLIRYPSIVVEETSPLLQNSNWTYKQIAGDPRVHNTERPVVMTDGDVFDVGSSNALGVVPYGYWHHWKPNNISDVFLNNAGFPCQNASQVVDLFDAAYETPSDYDDYFENVVTYGHFNIIGRCDELAKRIIPPPANSVYAGTNLHMADV